MADTPRPDDGIRAEAEAAFSAYLHRRAGGDEVDWASFCADRPSLADELRGLHAQWLAFHSFRQRLKERYGEGVDPGVSLEDKSKADEPAGSDSAWTKLVEQLSAHSPKASRYKLEGEIARGGMGAIIKVWDEDLRRHLAMKVVLGKTGTADQGRTPATDDRTLGRFLEEAQVTGQLDHPGVVPVHELGIDDEGLVYFTMRLVRGRDLKTVIGLARAGQDGWNQTRAVGVLLKACEALAYAHTKGVVHRDLKPANIMVGRFGEVYVMDWGLARVMGRPDRKNIRLEIDDGQHSADSLKTLRRDMAEETPDSPLVTMDGDVVGTPAYMSPEQARGDVEQVDARSDVYAMGAILYELLTGHMPYLPPGEKRTQRTILAAVLEGPPRAIRDLRRAVSPGLEAICEKAMARQPERRYADVDDLSSDLRAYLEGRVVRALRYPARSTLAAVAVLVPTVWLLVDLLLKLAAESNVGMHTLRLGAVGLAALALTWPLSKLGLRLSRGRRWTVAAAWVASLGLGVLGGGLIVGQRADQIHHAERDVLAHTIDFEGLGQRRDVDDLAAFASRWDDSLAAEDFLLLGRGFLKRLRPAQAEEWALRLELARAQSPDSAALMLAVNDALGDDAAAASAGERLWVEPTPAQGWTEWNRAGDVLADVERYEDARRAYIVASRRPDADQFRDLLNLKMAQVSAGLCEYADAADYLDDYIKWKPDDARANELAITIARRTGDWERADKHLATLEEGGAGTWATFVQNRYEVLKDQGKPDAAQDFVDQVARAEFTDFSVLDWCAMRAFEGQRLDVAESLWRQMSELMPDSATPYIGLSSVYYGRGEIRKSAEAARRAIELDPLFYQSYYNLALALQADLEQQRGNEANFSVADFGTILEPLRTALRYEHLQPVALNNAAYLIARMVEGGSSAASIDEAQAVARRSIRLLERAGQGACQLSDPQSSWLADAYDTLRGIEEVKGDTAAALNAARRALELLPLDEQDRRDAYGQAVERLEAQLGVRK